MQRTKKKAYRACYARNHMDAYMHLLYSYAVLVSHKSGVYYFDGEAVAEEFVRVGKRAVYAAKGRLIAEGWFIELAPPRRLSTGVFASGAYRVLTHQEWSKTHRGQCRTDSTNSRLNRSSNEERLTTSKTVPHSGVDRSSNGEWHRSSFEDQPFFKRGSSLVKIDNKESVSKNSFVDSEREGRGKAKAKAKAFVPASPGPPPPPSTSAAAQPPARSVSGKRMTDSKLVAAVRSQGLAYQESDQFVYPPDPEAGEVFRKHRRELGEALAIWVTEKYPELQVDVEMFVGLLLRLDGTNDELQIRRGGSALQATVEERMQMKGHTKSFDFVMDIYNYFPAFRVTYARNQEDAA